MKFKVVVGMRTKNENWIIDKTLKALSNFCDTVVIYDDQSTDNTEEICKSYDFVDWNSSPSRDPYIWNAGQQATDVFKFVEKHDPDYILMLDADEIPTPSIINFFDSIDGEVNLWKTRMVNLIRDQYHYRTDKYRTTAGVNINWNPFGDEAWSKHTLMKYNKEHSYTYEPLKIGLGSFGPVHPAPNNVPSPHKSTEDFYIFNNAQGSTALLLNSSNNIVSHPGVLNTMSSPIIDMISSLEALTSLFHNIPRPKNLPLLSISIIRNEGIPAATFLIVSSVGSSLSTP